MSKVICKVKECRCNSGGFCNKDFVSIRGGICQELVYKNGQQKPYEEWMSAEALDLLRKQQNI